MTKTFPLSQYKEAFNHAAKKATELNMAVGIEKTREFTSTIFRSGFLLPKKENRCGFELTCEVVEPGQPFMQ